MRAPDDGLANAMMEKDLVDCQGCSARGTDVTGTWRRDW